MFFKTNFARKIFLEKYIPTTFGRRVFIFTRRVFI